MKFTKYHALGNDYLILQEGLSTHTEIDMPQPELIRWICDRHHGVGADGILIAVASLHDRLSPKQERNVTTPPAKAHEEALAPSQKPLIPSPPHPPTDVRMAVRTAARTAVRILNPDGSEAEKSGNGLRIFARGLFDAGLVGDEPFDIDTLGGRVRCQVLDGGRRVRVGMGVVSFLPPLQFLLEGVRGWGDEERVPLPPHSLTPSSPHPLLGYPADIGNPHCVFFREAVSVEETLRLGPLIENDPRFPQRTNVQFAKVIDRHNMQLEIWERGAGYTLASGSSSCAACAVAVRLGLCDGDIAVHMPGGILHVEVSPDFHLTQTGPVARIAEINWTPDILDPD